jgi:uncharacterized delta-60 repeat protein
MTHTLRKNEARAASAAALLALALLASPPTAGADTGSGDLDTTFGTNGFEDLGSSSGARISRLIALADQGSARIYVADSNPSEGSGIDSVIVGRLASDGSLDTSFGTNGETVIDAAANSGARCVAVDGSGYIYVAGLFDGGDVVRLTPDGDVDTAWGTSGYADADGMDWAQSLVLTSTGDVIAAGRTAGRGSWIVWAAARFDGADGSLDTSFGKRGVWTPSFRSGSGVDTLAIDSQDRILLAGDGESFSQVVVRLSGSGDEDTTFGVAPTSQTAAAKGGKGGGGGGGKGGGGDDGGTSSDGSITLDFGGSSFVIRDLAVGSNDDFYVSATINLGVLNDPASDDEPCIAHYDANGVLDTGFGNGSGDQLGLAYPGMNGDQQGYGVMYVSGSVVQCGATAGSDGREFIVWRYDATDGTPDASFGPNSDGISAAADSGRDDLALTLILDAAGDIIVGGAAFDADATPFMHRTLARFCW